MIDSFAQFRAFFAFNAARNTAAARVVRHQYQVTAGQTDESGERRTLGAAFILVDLHDQLLAFAQRVLDAGAGDVYTGFEVGVGDFLEWQETVPLAAIIDKGGFEAGLDAGDDTLVDIAFALLFACGFNVQIEQFLTIYDCNAQFFRLRRVKQHAFHFFLLPRSVSRDGQTRARRSSHALLNHSVTNTDH